MRDSIFELNEDRAMCLSGLPLSMQLNLVRILPSCISFLFSAVPLCECSPLYPASERLGCFQCFDVSSSTV